MKENLNSAPRGTAPIVLMLFILGGFLLNSCSKSGDNGMPGGNNGNTDTLSLSGASFTVTLATYKGPDGNSLANLAIDTAKTRLMNTGSIQQEYDTRIAISLPQGSSNTFTLLLWAVPNFAFGYSLDNTTHTMKVNHNNGPTYNTFSLDPTSTKTSVKASVTFKENITLYLTNGNTQIVTGATYLLQP